MNEIKQNGLWLHNKIISKVQSGPKEGVSLNDWDSLWSVVREYVSREVSLLAYLNYKVLAGKFHESQPKFYKDETFDPKYLLRLRVFNQDEELLLWKRSDAAFGLRYRTDREGEDGYVVEAEQLLWGSVEAIEPGWIKLKDKGRGAELTIPWLSQDRIEAGSKVQIRTRNYIDYSEMGQAGYADSRLVKFLPCQEGFEHGKR